MKTAKTEILGKLAHTYAVTIWMAGDIETAKVWLRRYCFEKGACFTISPTSFIYTGGEETGFQIGLVNYPRFRSEPKKLDRQAKVVAAGLMRACTQKTALVVTPSLTYWYYHTPPGAKS